MIDALHYALPTGPNSSDPVKLDGLKIQLRPEPNRFYDIKIGVTNTNDKLEH